MIKITIEIFPISNECNKRTIGIMKIVNKFTSADNKATYSFVGYDDKSRNITGDVIDFDRDRGFWELMKECLNNMNQDL